MASDYIYKEKKKNKQYEDGASVRKNSLFIYSYKEQTHTYSEKKFGPEFSFFLKSSTDLSCVWIL